MGKKLYRGVQEGTPTLQDFLNYKAQEAKDKAVSHILQQDTPNVPRLPKGRLEDLRSWVAGWILGMSDEERIRRWGTSNPETCIYTATSQYKDEGALVSGNKTFMDSPTKYGFEEIPLDSVKVGDLLQFRSNGLFGETPHHSVLVTDTDSIGRPLVSYSKGSSHAYEVYPNPETDKMDTVYTMAKNKSLDVFSGWTPHGFRYTGSPQKRTEWIGEYQSKYNQTGLPVVELSQPVHIEQPDVLRVVKPQIATAVNKKEEGGFLKSETAWDALSMREKAEMMRVAVRNGITNLQEIRQEYNKFAEGGDKKPVTTGGAGYIPPANISYLANKIRGRLYRTVNPLSDYNIPKNAEAFLSGKYMDYGDIQTDDEENKYVEFEDGSAHVEPVDDIWAEYLQIPEGERRFKTRLQTSEYIPQKGGDDRNTYYKLPLTYYEKTRLLEETDDLPVGKNKVSEILGDYNLAEHTIGRGFDSKGEYRSYYDRWDLNPLNGKYRGWNIPFLNTLPDTTMGIGKPVEIYDRVYLDDYYGVPEPTHATYLPEVTVYSGKHKSIFEEIMREMGKKAEGGSIHIKPENRGKFTALKERTGHSATWFKEHGTPAQKKMATFALNARKWKHGDGGHLFDGLTEDSQQMQIGRGYWESQAEYPTLSEALAAYNKEQEEKRQQQLDYLRESLGTTGQRMIDDRIKDAQVEPNDNAWVDYSFTVKKPKNPHLHDRAVEGAKAHAAWEKEHPNLTAWGNVLGAVPFAVAAYPLAATIGSGLAALGDAAAATTAGQGLTNFLAPVATSTIAGVPAMEWANAGLTSMFGAHGIQSAVDEGGISPMTALEIAPMLQVAKPMVNEATTVVNTAINNGGFAVSSPRIGRVFGKDAGQFTVWVPFDRSWSKGLSWINTGAPIAEGLPVQYITSKHPGEARKLYDAAINKARREGHQGIITGRELISAPKTYSTLEHYYPNRVKLDDMGHWSNDSMTGLFEGPKKTVYTLDDFLQSVSETPNERIHFLGAPRYRLETPSTFQTRFSNTSNSNNANQYLNSDGSWNWPLIHQETRKGVTDARNFLGSDIKASSDAHNKELAERIGFNGFEPYAEAQKRASVPIAPEFYSSLRWEGEPHAGLTVRFADNPEKDRMLLSLSDNVNNGGFHETFHRGYYGEAGPGAQGSATEQLYIFKKDKLLASRTEENAEWVDYLSKANGGEAATNAMDIGRRMGIAPGTPWPGRKKAMELFEKYAGSSDTKTNAFNAFNWKQKPRRVWDAITGRYFVLGGTISTSAFIDK